MRTVAVLLAAAGVLALASCGSGGDSNSSSTGGSSTTGTTEGPTRTITKSEARQIRRTRARTVAKVNRVCRSIGQLPPITISVDDNPLEAQRAARRLGREYKRAAAELASVNARASQSRRDVGSGALRATKALKDAGQVLGQIEGAAQGGDLSTVGPEIERLKSDINRYQATVRRFGFKDCY